MDDTNKTSPAVDDTQQPNIHWPEWMANSDNDMLNEWLDRSEPLALSEIKHESVRQQDALTAFYVSQRMLALTHMQRPDDPAVLDMLVESMDACLQLGLTDKGILQGELADKLLCAHPRKSGDLHLYVLYALALVKLERGQADQTLALLDRIQELLATLPAVGWEEPEKVGLLGLRVEALLRKQEKNSLAAAKKLLKDTLAWAEEAGRRGHKDQKEKAFSYMGHALNLNIQAALLADEATWALNSVCGVRGMMLKLFPDVDTLHSINPDTYQRVIKNMQSPTEHLVDYVEYEDLFGKKQLLVFTSPQADARVDLQMQPVSEA